MTKHYFFKTVRINGHQKLRALPGQTTYKDYRHQFEPVDTEINVQTPRPARTIQCSYPDGTVFIAKIEGVTYRDTKLLVHTRGGETLYRLEQICYPVMNSDAEYLDMSHKPTDGMLADYGIYLTAQANAQPAAQPAPAQETSSAAPTEDPTANLSINGEELLKLGKLGLEEIRAIDSRVNSDILNKICRVRDLMAIGIVKFTYRKQNDDIRVAYGTRMSSIIPPALRNNERLNEAPDGVHFNYFDIQKRDWRCFCTDCFIDIDTSFFSKNQFAVPPVTA